MLLCFDERRDSSFKDGKAVALIGFASNGISPSG